MEGGYTTDQIATRTKIQRNVNKMKTLTLGLFTFCLYGPFALDRRKAQRYQLFSCIQDFLERKYTFNLTPGAAGHYSVIILYMVLKYGVTLHVGDCYEWKCSICNVPY